LRPTGHVTEQAGCAWLGLPDKPQAQISLARPIRSFGSEPTSLALGLLAHGASIPQPQPTRSPSPPGSRPLHLLGPRNRSPPAASLRSVAGESTRTAPDPSRAGSAVDFGRAPVNRRMRFESDGRIYAALAAALFVFPAGRPDPPRLTPPFSFSGRPLFHQPSKGSEAPPSRAAR
jgi:hypothetical protein